MRSAHMATNKALPRMFPQNPQKNHTTPTLKC